MVNLETITSEWEKLEHFFKYHIVDFLLEERFWVFYKNFLDDEEKICSEKIKDVVDSIFILINKYDLTSLRPNNISWIDEDFLSEFLDKCSDDLYIFLQYNHSSIDLDWKKILDKFEFTNNSEFIKKVKDELILYKYKNFSTQSTEVSKIIDSVKKSCSLKN